MKKYLTLFFPMILTFCSVQSFGQTDTTAIKNFIQKQEPDEEKFMTFLKDGKIENCMKYFSTGVIKKYGVDSLKKELEYLNILFSSFILIIFLFLISNLQNKNFQLII